MQQGSHRAALKAEPPAPIKSLPELFAMAGAMEAEAASRYAAMAQEMQALAMPSLAAVFAHLAEEERHHAAHVHGLACTATGTPPDPTQLSWEPWASFDVEEARDFASSSHASAYGALSMAVRNEERSFAFWSYVAAQATTPEVRQAAERLAREELVHAALLRRERRRAFHAQRPQRLPPLARAAAIEAQLALLLEQTGGASSLEARQLSEQLVDAYLEAADAATTEAEVAHLQGQAEAAIGLVVRLRQRPGAAATPPSP